MEQGLCYSCFQQVEPGVRFCPNCGRPLAQDWDAHPHALPYGTVLAGRYITGRVLGQGGFGITYAAQDHKTGQLVAIKEFFPDSMAARGEANSIVPYTGQRGEDFFYGKDAFLEEAKTLAQFNSEPGIVHVYSYYEEYGTAYFAMEYVDGISLQKYIDDRGGKISTEEADRILLPVMDALTKVHAQGIIHRDIKPDNIYIDSGGAVRILDFGSARYSMGEKSRSLDVVLTHGFAPREQYSRHGRQGAYTDVYAMAATYYYAVTGRKPPDSIDRLDEDTLAMPSSLGAQLSHAKEDVLLKALSVEPQDRYGTMAEFRYALEHADAPAYASAAAAGTGGASNFTVFPGAPAAPSGGTVPGGNAYGSGPAQTGAGMNSSAIPRPADPAGGTIPQTGTADSGGAARQGGPSGAPAGPAQAVDPSGGAPAPGAGQRFTETAASLTRQKWFLPACAGGAVALIAIILAIALPGKNKTGTELPPAAPTEISQTAAPTETPKPPESMDPYAGSGSSGSSLPVSGGGSPVLSGSAPVLTGGGATQSAEPAGYYPISSLSMAGIMMDTSGMTMSGIDVDSTYVVLGEDGTGTLSIDGEATDIRWDDAQIRLTGTSESYAYTLSGGELRMTIEEEGVSIDFVFVRSDKPAPASGGSGAEALASGKCGENAWWELRGDTLYITGTGKMDDYQYTEDIPWLEYAEAMDFVEIADGITRIGEGAFYSCEMVNVEIPDSVETIGAYAFMDCPYLFDITIPASVKGIGTAVLQNCENLEEVTILSPSIAIWADAFTLDESLTEVYFGGSIERVEEDAFYGVTANVYYPAGNTTWDPIVCHDYGGDLNWVPTGNASAADAEARYFSGKFSVAMPQGWAGKYTADANSETISVYHTDSAQYGAGGFLFQLRLFSSYSEYATIPSYEVVGKIADKKGHEYTLVAIYPSDVQFPAAYQEEYLSMLNNTAAAFRFVSGEDGYTFTKA